MRPGEIPQNMSAFNPYYNIWSPYPAIYMPFGFFPRPQIQTEISAVSKDILEKVDLRPSENFEQLSKQRLNLASSLASVNILESETPQLVLAFGPNSSGKSTFLKQTKEILEENGLSVVVFKSRQDTRGNDPNKAWTRTGDFPAIPVNHISEVMNFLNLAKDKIIALDETQLLGKPEEILEFIKTAKQNGFSVIADILSRDLNGDELDHTQTILSEASMAFELEPYDRIDPSKPADHTMLCVAVSSKGEILDSDTSKGFYENMSSQERTNVANKLISMENGHRFVIKKPEGFSGVQTAILLPSAYEDKKVVHHPDRYVPVSKETFQKIFQTIGFQPPEIKPKKDYSKYQNVTNWENFDLGYTKQEPKPPEKLKPVIIFK